MLQTSSLRRLALVALVVIGASACASRPKPLGPAATSGGPPAPPPRPEAGDRDRLGPVGESGLPDGQGPGSAHDFIIHAGDLVYFDFDRFEVRNEARAVLDTQAGWLSRYPGVRVRIEGNTDQRGTREYNFALGARRANAVREYLVERGIAAERIDTVSYGKEHPTDLGSDDHADSINRNARTVVIGGAR